jgi:glycosyltransferase involved in cell wall biosynthesis
VFSIVTPVLNCSTFIEQTIQSIQKLTCHYEHIIVDGGSTDGTLEVIKKYGHIKLLHQSGSQGMYEAINQGINASSGSIVSWVNADDIIIAEKYVELIYKMERKKAQLGYSDALYHFIDNHRYEFVPALPFATYFLRRGIMPFVQPSAIFTKKLYEELGGIDFKKFRIIGDRDFFQRAAFIDTLQIVYLPAITTVFMRRDDTLYFANEARVSVERGLVQRTADNLFNRLLLHFLRFIKKLFHR